MDVTEATSHNINNLYNLTTSLATSISFHQLIVHIRSVFANLCDSLNYIWMVSAHTMDYIDTATSGTLSPHILPVMDVQKMLLHISDTLPPTLHLPVSPDDTLHFYRYIHTHVLIKDKQFLLLVDVPIQDRSWQITIHKVLTLSIPHGNFSARYDISTKYQGCNSGRTFHSPVLSLLGSSQFCSITTAFQPLANPPLCVATLYARSSADITSQCSLQIRKTSDVNLPTQISPDVWIVTTPLSTPASTVKLICPEKATETITIRKPLHVLRVPMACSATSPNFYKPPKYQTSNLEVNFFLKHGRPSHDKHFSIRFPHMAVRYSYSI